MTAVPPAEASQAAAPASVDLRHARYLSERHLPASDITRGVAVLLIVGYHYGHERLLFLALASLTAFFVLSGYLITRLLLREEAHRGRVSLRASLARRVCRIVPLYLVVLAAYVAFTARLGGAQWAAMREALPYYLTFNGEFAPTTYFQMSWTLGIEEKYYLLWPPLAFAITMRTTRRLGLCAGLIALLLAAGALEDLMLVYVPILCGCTAAVVMHHPEGFARCDVLRRHAVAALLGAALLLAFLLLPGLPSDAGRGGGLSVVVGGLLLALMIPWFADRSGGRPGSPVRVLDWVGRRSYGTYLLQSLVAGLLAVTVDVGGKSVGLALCVALVSVAGAHVLHHTVELPGIEVGRRLTRRWTSSASAEAPRPAG